MLLADADRQKALETVAASFPHLADREYRNDVDDDYGGFTVWGEFALDPDELTAPRFFITSRHSPDDRWRSGLAVGKYACFWISADVGDAYLLDMPPCATLEEAIAALKKAMRPFAPVVTGDWTGLRD